MIKVRSGTARRVGDIGTRLEQHLSGVAFLRGGIFQWWNFFREYYQIFFRLSSTNKRKKKHLTRGGKKS